MPPRGLEQLPDSLGFSQSDKSAVPLAVPLKRDTEQLLTLWDALSDDSKAAVLAMMQAIDARPPIDPMLGVENGYPVGYFAETAGALADEPFERAPQGDLPDPKAW